MRLPCPTSPHRLFLTACAALCVTLLSLGAASAGPLVHRNNDGSLSINPLLCYTDYQVRQAIAAAGYGNIFLNAPIEAHVQVRGTKGRWVYLIDFNRCSGSIVGVQRLRKAG